MPPIWLQVLQQLGRGLRTFRGKQYLNVLDFIGNYEKAGRVRFYLTGHTSVAGRSSFMPADAEYPDMSRVYKMPVLMAFYNDGQMRMAVTEEELLASWKA